MTKVMELQTEIKILMATNKNQDILSGRMS